MAINDDQGVREYRPRENYDPLNQSRDGVNYAATPTELGSTTASRDWYTDSKGFTPLEIFLFIALVILTLGSLSAYSFGFVNSQPRMSDTSSDRTSSTRQLPARSQEPATVPGSSGVSQEAPLTSSNAPATLQEAPATPQEAPSASQEAPADSVPAPSTAQQQ